MFFSLDVADKNYNIILTPVKYFQNRTCPPEAEDLRVFKKV